MPIVFKISEMLSKVFNKKHESDGDYLTIEEIMKLLHERGFGIMIVLFALPNLFPGFVPPIPSLFAIPLCLFSVQMILRYESPHLPRFISKRRLKRESLQKAISKSMPVMRKIEGLIRPRLPFMVSDGMERYLGVFLLLFAATIAIPLPMTNFMPAVAMLFIGVGILSKDGLVVLFGVILGTVWILLLFFLSQELIAFLTSVEQEIETIEKEFDETLLRFLAFA